jgi:peptidoglycan hydrolase CwlO-like protein
MKGQELAQRLKRLSSDMSISYVKLLTALGNLDNSMGKSQEAMGAWVMAAKICQSLNASSPKLDVKAETKRCFDALLPAIQSVGQKLQAEQDEAKKQADETKAAEEQAAAAAQEAEKAAAERLAAEQKAAEEQAAAEKAAQEAANKRVRNRRRR